MEYIRDGNVSCSPVMDNDNRITGVARLRMIFNDIYTYCYDTNSICYACYGGRGITMCDEWSCEDGFANFCKWALSHGYHDDLMINLKDNTMQYSPENCCWVFKILEF